MKTITTFLAVSLVALAGSAMADQQRSDEAAGYALSQRAAQGSGAYASVRAAARVRTRAVEAPYAIDLSGIPAAR
jgi:hypothetical protein